jgi:hypothetical protein
VICAIKPILNKLSFQMGRSEDRMMIKVRAPLEVKVDPQGGWEVVFWLFDAFDYTTPFRAMLAEITDALEQDPEIDLQLPAYEENEDFVEGALQFGLVKLRVYYEHSLSYAALSDCLETLLVGVPLRAVI